MQIHDKAVTATSADPLAARRRGVGGLLLLLAMLAGLALRFLYAWRYAFDSDESQHLHIVWGWTRGLLQYRDLFDNHMPLFHVLYAPILRLVGERADVLQFMRLAVLPLYVAMVALTEWTGTRLYGRRVGLVAAAVLALYPRFYLRSLEFRTDDLWALFWVASLAALARGRLNWRSGLLVGLLLGGALAVSLKSILMVASVAITLAWMAFAAARENALPARSRLLWTALAGLVGVVAPAACIVGYFVARGAGHDFYYATIGHNVGAHGGFAAVRLLLPLLVALLLWQMHDARRRHASIAAAAPELAAMLPGGLYLVLLYAFWPLLDYQDYLPAYAYFALCAGVLLERLELCGPRWVAYAPLLVVVLEFGGILHRSPPWVDGTQAQTQLIAQTLQLTDPGDQVCDLKGETVFRSRALYPVFERITRQLIRENEFPLDIPGELSAKGTCVVSGAFCDFLAARPAGEFLRENYVPVGRLWVAGQYVAGTRSDVKAVAGVKGAAGATEEAQPASASSGEGGGAIAIEVRIGADYRIVDQSGVPVACMLDGSPFTSARFIAAGKHELRLPAGTGPVALVWAKAIDRGFTPEWKRGA